jgi:LysR family nitrogen assimilation transcriptional regulator
MDLKQLEYFVRVAELGSFTRAAAVLGVAQPALSRQVRLLEVELRQSLLLRNGRGATVTESGRILLEHGRGILHQIARAREDLAQAGRMPAGRVAVGLPPTIARVLTVPLTRAFRKRLPQARLTISEGLSAAMIEALAAGRLDVALLYNSAPAPELELKPLREEQLLLISKARRSPAAPKSIRLADVASLPLIVPSRPNAIRMRIESVMAGIGCRPTIAFEIDGVAAILALVADGAGHAILPPFAVTTAPRPDALVAQRIVRPGITSRLDIATSARRPATLTQQAMIGLIEDVARAEFNARTDAGAPTAVRRSGTA